MAILASPGCPVGNVRSATVMEISTQTQLENATVLLESALTVCTRQLVFIVTIVRKVTSGMPSTEHVEVCTFCLNFRHTILLSAYRILCELDFCFIALGFSGPILLRSVVLY